MKTLSQILKQKDSQELMTKLMAADVTCGPLLSVGEMIDDPQVIAREMIIDSDYPELGRIKIGRSPLTFSETMPQARRRAPLLGEHTTEILKELEYSEAEINQLAEKGIILQHKP